MNRFTAELNYYKAPIIGALIQWFITIVLQVDRNFFSYDAETNKMIIIKELYLVVLIVAWCFFTDAYRKIKAGDSDYKRGFYIFVSYLSILMILLVFLWPGTWSWDDLWTINSICRYSTFREWQHILSGIYQDILLQILPFPGGIILLQNIIASLCVAFIIVKLEKCYNIKIFKNPIIDLALKLIPFLLPPVLMYQFSGYRIGIYVHLEAVMIIMLMCAIKDKKEWQWKYLFLLCFLTVIVSNWRTESFFYIPFAAILVLLVDKCTLSMVKKIICIAILFLGFMGMDKWQKSELGNSNYEVISLMCPCVELVRTADYTEDAIELAAIDKVTDVSIIHEHPTATGAEIYWGTKCVRNRNDNPDDDYTEEDYNNYLKAFIKLSLKYPKVVIFERWNLFLKGSGITGESNINISNAYRLFEPDRNDAAQAVLEHNWIAYSPVFKERRKKLIYILGARRPDGSVRKKTLRLVWNAIIPMIILFYAWFKMLTKKKWYLLLLCTAVLIRIPVVVLTQPSCWIMYVMSFYFLGYVFAVYKFLSFLGEKSDTQSIENVV